nr:EOG090X0CGF [Ceriodaphnia reticulata]
MGKTFLNHITQSGRQVNTATIVRFLSLCYFCSKEVEDKNEVEKMCLDVKSSSQYLDSATKENIILGLSITEKWREGLQLLIEDETTHHSLPVNAMVDCLINNNEIDAAVPWLNKMAVKERKISDFVYENWIRKCATQPQAWNMLSEFLVWNTVFLKQTIVQQLKDMLEGRTFEPFTGQFTTVAEATGRCQSCQKSLANTDVTDEEFTALRKRLLENVLFGKDVFIGSKPEELRKFQEFIQKTAPYDVVIDGLNVAYHQAAKSRDQPARKVQLQSVIKHFTSRKQRVLVLTRKHLLQEPALQNMKKQAHIFITDNLSQDDPFLLYAAVQSKHTKFVSDDLFRDHLYRLADPQLQNIFRLWQHRAQMQIVSFGRNGGVEFHHPRNYRTVSQFAEVAYHLALFTAQTT